MDLPLYDKSQVNAVQPIGIVNTMTENGECEQPKQRSMIFGCQNCFRTLHEFPQKTCWVKFLNSAAGPVFQRPAGDLFFEWWMNGW